MQVAAAALLFYLSSDKRQRRCFCCQVVEMATAQRTRPRAVVGAPRRAAWQLKSALRHSISAAPRTIIFLHFFTIIVGDAFFMNNNG